MTNRIVEENARTDGVADRSYWDAAHSRAIEGFATDISVNAGGTVDFKINVNDGGGSDYKVEIFRLGYYGGSGAREVAAWTNTDAVDQALPLYDESRGLVDAGNWVVTDSWDIPADAVSGVYLARVQRLDANGDPIEGETNQIPFIVRNDGVAADIVLQTSDTTWHAYNGWAGELVTNAAQAGPNFYGDQGGIVDHDPLPNSGTFAQDRAYAVSYNRPFITRDYGGVAAGPQDYLFGADYAAIHWLEQNGYDVTYISGVDTDRLGTSWYANDAGEVIRKSFISVGHDEYWSGDQRINVESARDDGVHLMFWSGNEMYWKTRWETSISADGTEYRTLVCYKETWANGDPNAGPDDYNNIDPSNVWTGTWRDTRFWEAVQKDASGNVVLDANGQPIYIAGGQFYIEGGGNGNQAYVDSLTGLRSTCNCAENSLTGTLFGPDGTGERASIDIPEELGNLRVWRNTAIADAGDDLDLLSGILGYEWNTVPEDELRPAGLIRLSSTTRAWSGIVVDQGNSAPPGVATHSLSLYRAESGALVFGAGTTFWTWGLSDEHDISPYSSNDDNTIESTAIQQFTVNMFADMGIQPGVADAILASQGLVRALASTDVTPATAEINDLPDEVAAQTQLTITGTAADVGGVVALVEVSFDGGTTWRVAQSNDGWDTWIIAWRPVQEGVVEIKARAIDDSLNVHNATPDSETITVTAPIPPSSYSLFKDADTSGAVLGNDGATLQIGMKFNVTVAGTVSELKYLRLAGDANDADVRVGYLWRVSDGALLGTATFVSEAGVSGWQVASLAAPVTLTPGVEYIVSYVTDDNYAVSNRFFQPANEIAFDGRDDDAFSDYWNVIRAPQNSIPGDGTAVNGNGNGVYDYGAASAMPDNTYRSANYWVDVTFVPYSGPNTPPVITSGNSFTIAENGRVVGSIVATDAENPVTYAIAGGADADLFTINPTTGLLSFNNAPNFEAPTDRASTSPEDPAGNNIYNLVVAASDGIAAPVTQAITVTVTDVDPEPVVASRLYDPGAVSPGSDNGDTADYELGTKFRSSLSGFVTTLQYYRVAADSADTDVRTLNLWTATGVNLGSVTVTAGAGETGWQVGTLSTPIAITAGAVYIVSYGFDDDGVADSYAFTPNYFAVERPGADGVLTALASGTSGGNGVFAESGPGNFPTATYNASNYWTDVTFVTEIVPPNAPPVITSEGGADMVSKTVDENSVLVSSLSATDANAGQTITFSLSGEDAGLFEIVGTQLRFITAPDAEAPPDAGATAGYQVTVTASDGAGGTDTQAFVIEIGDVNEFAVTAPVDTDSTANGVLEGAAAGTLVGITALAADNDATTNAVTYSLTNSAGGRFAIDATTGVVSVADGTLLDYETATSHQITVRASSADGSVAETVFTIMLGDVNEFAVTAPVDTDGTADRVSEGAATGTLVGITAQSSDGDGSADVVTYWLTDTAGGRFAIDTTTGVVSVADGTLLDYETATSHQITVRASSTDGSIAETVFTILLDDVNEFAVTAPVDIDGTANSVLEGAATGTLAGITASASDGDGTTNAVTYSLTDTAGGRFAIDTTTGVVSVADGTLLDYETATSHEITVRASSADGSVAETVFTIAVGDVVETGVTLTGTSSNNTLTGGPGNDTISGLGGRDTLSGLGGADVILGGTGTDSLFGGDGNDTLDGGAGADTINGGNGDDVIIIRDAEALSDVMFGGAGTDTLQVASGSGPVTLRNLVLTDVEAFVANGVLINGDTAANVFDLTTFASVTGVTEFRLLEGNDQFLGSAQAEVIDGGSGTDTLYGGGGDDVIIIRNSEAVVDVMFGGEGRDTLQVAATSGPVTLRNLVFPDIEVFIGNGGIINGDTTANVFDFSTFETVTGVSEFRLQSGNDSFVGSALGEVIDGGAGNDTLYGGGGDDVIVILNAEAASDVMFGGAGIDTIRVASTSGVVTLANLQSDFERFEGAGKVVQGTSSANVLDFSTFAEVIGVAAINGLGGNDRITGTQLADLIDGGGGNDTIIGGAGADTIIGGNGNDILTGGADADRFVFNVAPNASSNVDRVTDFVSGVDTLAFSAAVFTGLAADLGGLLDPVRFHIGANAADADDRLIYDSALGNLYYDSNGSASGSRVLVATLSGAPTLLASDIVII
jgi:Ca2+-binding RTX toxin-like protein